VAAVLLRIWNCTYIWSTVTSPDENCPSRPISPSRRVAEHLAAADEEAALLLQHQGLWRWTHVASDCAPATVQSNADAPIACRARTRTPFWIVMFIEPPLFACCSAGPGSPSGPRAFARHRVRRDLARAAGGNRSDSLLIEARVYRRFIRNLLNRSGLSVCMTS